MARYDHKMLGKIQALLAENLPPRILRDKLESLVAEGAEYRHSELYQALTLIAPDLYRLHKGIFRTFILCHWMGSKWSPKLDGWLTEVERDKDYDLFRRLYAWKLREIGAVGRGAAEKLIALFQGATSQGERRTVIELFNSFTFFLQETEAMLIYSVEPSFTTGFILGHLNPVRGLYFELVQLAMQNDEDFAWALYRKTASMQKWADEARDLCRRATSSQALTVELEKRHPEGLTSQTKAEWQDAVLQLLEINRALVTRYALLHADLFEQKQIEICRQKVYPELWAEIAARSKNLNNELEPLLFSRLPDSSIRLHLGALFQNNYTYNLNYRYILSDKVTLEIYKRFPDLMRANGKCLVFNNSLSFHFNALIDAMFKADDEELIDYVAGRLLLSNKDRFRSLSIQGRVQTQTERFVSYYNGLLRSHPKKFPHRIMRVLTQVPQPEPIYGPNLEDRNVLAGYIFDYAAVHLPTFFDGQTLYLKQIGRQVGIKGALKDPIVVENHRQTLLPSLLKPAEKKARVQSFDLLASLPNDEPSAHLVLERAREAMALEDPAYPKGALLTLIARILHKWPNLRAAKENPVIYEGA